MKQFHKWPILGSLFVFYSKSDNGGLWISYSYNISLFIAKSEKPHTFIGKQLILLVIEVVLKTVLHKPAFSVLKCLIHLIL